MIYPDNPLLTLSDLEDDDALNELELREGKDYVSYIREDLRIAHERRVANLRLQAQMQTEIMSAKQAQMKERHLVRLGGLI